MRVLFIPAEFSTWHAARSWSYSVQLALIEGFTACGLEVTTIPSIRGLPADLPSSWLHHAPRMFDNNSFDQVWMEVVHSDPGTQLMEWVAGLAPVRVGLVGESLDYDDEAVALHPHLRYRRQLVESRLSFMTHALFADERDAEAAEAEGKILAQWWPQAVPERVIGMPDTRPAIDSALFAGVAYGSREKWLSDPLFSGLVQLVRSEEHATNLPALFDRLQSMTLKALAEGLQPEKHHLKAYVDVLTYVRRACFDCWLSTLRKGSAIVNLPSHVRAYAGRVVEGMAAGRPVVSWEIPDRPRTRGLFEPEREILLFPPSQPDELARILRRLIGDSAYSSSISENARLNLLKYHTIEKRIRQMLLWINSGIQPEYSEPSDSNPDCIDRFDSLFDCRLHPEKKVNQKEQLQPDADSLMADVQDRVAAGDLKGAIVTLESAGHYPEVKGMLAHLHLAAGDTEKAAELIHQAIADEPGRVEYLIDAIRLLVEKKNTASALKFLKNAWKCHPNESQVKQLNLLSMECRPWIMSLPTRSEAIPLQVSSAMDEARLLVKRGKINEACDVVIAKAIAADKDSPLPYVLLTEILIRSRRHDDALLVLPEIPATTEPGLVHALESICHSAMGDDAAARVAAEKALSGGTERAAALLALGTLTARTGDAAAAEEFFNRAVAADSTCSGALLSLSMLAWSAGRYESAWNLACRAVAADPVDEETIGICRDMAQRCGKIEVTSEFFRELYEADPDCRAAALTAVSLLQECGHLQDAIRVARSYLARAGADEKVIDCALVVRQTAGLADDSPVENNAISLCMIVKNEEQVLARCLASVEPLVDEMVVVDTGSTDRTVDIATVFGARVFHFDWNGNFSDARNLGVDQSRGRWILVLDADEALAAADHDKLREAVSGAEKVAWSVMTRNYTPHINTEGWTANDGSYSKEEKGDGWYPSWKIRLFPNDSALRFSGQIHEMVETSAREAGYELLKAPFVVHHYGELEKQETDVSAKQRAYFELGKQKLAERPDDLSALAELAAQATGMGLLTEALQLWDRVLALRTDTVEALFNKGYVLIGLKRYAEAMEVSRKAFELDPEHKEAALNFGVCELYVGNPERALAALTPIVEKNVAYPLLQALFGVLCLCTGRSQQGTAIMAELQLGGYAADRYLHERAASLQAVGRNDLAEILLNAPQTWPLPVR